MNDVTGVDNPYALLAVLAVLLYLAWKQRKTEKHSKRAADAIEHESKPNSGSSMKDSLNRIEARQEQQDARLAVLEQAVEKRGHLRGHR